jgi:hypothetical protein
VCISPVPPLERNVVCGVLGRELVASAFLSRLGRELCAGLGMVVVVVAEKGGGRSRGQSGTRSRQRVLYHNSSDGGKQRPSIQISVYTGPIARFLVGNGPFKCPYVICRGEARTLQAAGSSRVPRQLWLRCTKQLAGPVVR